MNLKSLKVKNFRALDDVTLNIENDLTLIVGKNNTGKTSVFEILNFFLVQEKRELKFENFSHNSYLDFKSCEEIYYKWKIETKEEEERERLEIELIEKMPKIQLELNIEYLPTESLINISDFITDLDENKTDVKIRLSFESKETLKLFEIFENREIRSEDLIVWLNQNIKNHYHLKCYAGDEAKALDDIYRNTIKKILKIESIQASRKLDDITDDKNRTLEVGFSDYYKQINKENNDDVKRLEDNLKNISKDLESQYKEVLKNILKELSIFGIEPNINIPEIDIKSIFESEKILEKNIKYYYKNGEISLPENFNGLGYSNLIYLVLKVVSFIDKFKKARKEEKSEFLLILIEEPEAHLHPQMQQVFIKEITKLISKHKIPIQVIISSHSSHIITEAGIDEEKGFDRIRYFNFSNENGVKKIVVNDFNDFKVGCQKDEKDKSTYKFLKQYMNLHKCDLFFADKVIMLEGITEKLLLPKMIDKVAPSLKNEYISILEVGGAYTHKFEEILKFIGIKTLIITDIDSINPTNRETCKADAIDAITSNATLKSWIPKKTIINELIVCNSSEKFDGDNIRVCFQIPEIDNGFENDYCARSLEEAIINKNISFFKDKYSIVEDGETKEVEIKSKFELLRNSDINQSPYQLAPKSRDKSTFTFDLIMFDEKESNKKWEVPLYIKEGLEWLAGMCMFKQNNF